MILNIFLPFPLIKSIFELQNNLIIIKLRIIIMKNPHTIDLIKHKRHIKVLLNPLRVFFNISSPNIPRHILFKSMWRKQFLSRKFSNFILRNFLNFNIGISLLNRLLFCYTRVWFLDISLLFECIFLK